MKLLLNWLLQATALLALAHVYPGVQIADFSAALAAALLIGFFNLFVRPALIVLTLPVTVLSLGLFLFVINAGLFWAAAGVIEGFGVTDFGAALVGSIVYSLFGVLIDSALQQLFPPQVL